VGKQGKKKSDDLGPDTGMPLGKSARAAQEHGADNLRLNARSDPRSVGAQQVILEL
jgi:hypothetical protein